MNEEFQMVKLSEIAMNPLNPRKNFEGKKFDELVKSIKEKGVIEPVLLRRLNGGYQLVAGERRFRGCMKVMNIRHRRQTNNENCGQACVAMLADMPIEWVSQAIGKDGGTRAQDIIRGLRFYGFNVGDRFTVCGVKKNKPPDLCIIKLSFEYRKKQKSHYVLRNGDFYHDPSFEKPFFRHMPLFPPWWTRMVSYLEIQYEKHDSKFKI